MKRPMVLRSVLWYGDGSGQWEFEAIPPVEYQRTIVSAAGGYRVTGTSAMTHDPDSPRTSSWSPSLTCGRAPW